MIQLTYLYDLYFLENFFSYNKYSNIFYNKNASINYRFNFYEFYRERATGLFQHQKYSKNLSKRVTCLYMDRFIYCYIILTQTLFNYHLYSLKLLFHIYSINF